MSQSQINLSWTGSTDNVGVTGYRLERCQGASCSNFVEIATPSGTSHPDTGLSPATTYRYRVRAADAAGNLSGYSNIASATTQTGSNTAPTAVISTPTNGTLWKVGDVISFSGSATDAQDGTVATSGLSWTLLQQHCPSTCHSHTVQTFNGVAGGSFAAPDHDYPSYLDLVLTATDSGGLTDTETVRLDPRTVVLTFQSSPTGLQLTVGSSSGTTTFTRTVIEGSTNSISAASPQTLGGTTYNFVSWSDGGAASHNIVATATATYTATFQAGAGPTPVAAYSFNEGSGTTVADASGTGNAGTIGTATWTTQGKFGNALSFNGTSARVTVPDASSLDLTTAMTLEAWVNPTALGGWRDVVYKANDVYFLEGSTPSAGNPPSTGGTFGGEIVGQGGLALNTWSHLAGTYDGSTMRLYVNGVQVASRAQTGPIQTSTLPLTIGGDAIWSQAFAGRIDEVRVYSTALTQAQIQTDMNAPIGGGGPPDTQAPTSPSNLTATPVSQSQINLSWTGSTDNVGVTGYRLERCQGASCSNFVEIATPSGTSHPDTGLSPATTYRYRVRAADAAGNLSGYSNIASATTQTGTTPTPVAAYSFNEGSGTTVADASGNGECRDDRHRDLDDAGQVRQRSLLQRDECAGDGARTRAHSISRPP